MDLLVCLLLFSVIQTEPEYVLSGLFYAGLMSLSKVYLITGTLCQETFDGIDVSA